MSRCLTVVSCMLIIITRIATVTGQLTSQGLGNGELCGGVYCLSRGVTCNDVKQKCECDNGSGRGEFACYAPDEIASRTVSDPNLVTFGGDSISVDTPCRYYSSHVETQWKKNENKILGTCDIKVYSFPARVLGKFYTAGTDFVVQRKSTNGQKEEYVIRVAGYANNGLYQYSIWFKTGFFKSRFTQVSNSPFELADGVKIKLEKKDNRIVVTIGQCGLTAYFRPSDVELGRDQVFLAGLSLAYKQTHEPVFKSDDQVLMLSADTSAADVAAELGLSVNDAFLYRALSGHTDQNFPWAPSLCRLVPHIASSCVNKAYRAQAFEMCSFILTSSNFVRCWSASDPHDSDAVLLLFAQCLKTFCHRIEIICRSLVRSVNDETCSEHAYPGLRFFKCESLEYVI